MREVKPITPLVNLNADSDHPNPWKPRTMYEQHTMFWNPYKIYRGQPEDVYPIHNYLSQEPLWTKLGVAAWKGFVFGELSSFEDPPIITKEPCFLWLPKSTVSCLFNLSLNY